jgi:hypothetical protein
MTFTMLFHLFTFKFLKYKTVVGGSILNYSAILKFGKKSYLCNEFLWIDVFKFKVFNDLDENWLNYVTFVCGGHFEFLYHFEVIFLKTQFFLFLWSIPGIGIFGWLWLIWLFDGIVIFIIRETTEIKVFLSSLIKLSIKFGSL